MHRTVRLVAFFAGGFILLSCAVLVVNQSAQVVQLADRVDPALGTATFWALVLTYGGLAGVPVVLLLRLPRPLVPPDSDEGPEFAAHLKRLGSRLGASPHLAGCDLSSREGVEDALRILDAKADAVVREASASVFLATAVSQSGRLDGLLVLAAQSRMVWQVAHLYHQRPAARDLARLYTNVAATTFAAGELQDLDLGEQVEPILSSAVSALGASLPGLQVAGTLLANCVLSGSANAFLTLRVGMITKRYCGALVAPPKAGLRRAATAEAAALLGGIVTEGTARLSRALWRVSADKFGAAMSNVSGFAKDAGAKFLARVRNARAQEV